MSFRSQHTVIENELKASMCCIVELDKDLIDTFAALTSITNTDPVKRLKANYITNGGKSVNLIMCILDLINDIEEVVFKNSLTESDLVFIRNTKLHLFSLCRHTENNSVYKFPYGVYKLNDTIRKDLINEFTQSVKRDLKRVRNGIKSIWNLKNDSRDEEFYLLCRTNKQLNLKYWSYCDLNRSFLRFIDMDSKSDLDIKKEAESILKELNTFEPINRMVHCTID